jgi:hypothetical protein
LHGLAKVGVEDSNPFAWPTKVTPRSFRCSAVKFGSTPSSISLSRKCLLVTFQLKAAQPRRYVHAMILSSSFPVAQQGRLRGMSDHPTDPAREAGSRRKQSQLNLE